MLSCQGGHEHCARALIEAKAALDTQDSQDFTALMIACSKNHEECARALIEAGAEKDKTGPQNATALMLACQNGHDLCARALIEAGANVNHRANGETALTLSLNNETIAQLLIEAGAWQ